jgi:hypothetical protein
MNFKKPNPLVKLLTKVVMSEPPLDPSLFVRSGVTSPRLLLSMIDLAMQFKRPETHLYVDYEIIAESPAKLSWNIQERLP